MPLTYLNIYNFIPSQLNIGKPVQATTMFSLYQKTLKAMTIVL